MEEFEQHYDQIDEKSRLDAGFGLIEKERTKQIILRYLSEKHARILDVGGAAGVYSFWLAGLGHEVHLGDATAKHISQASAINARSNAQLASISVMDARDLSQFEDASMDCILLFGPLYHLVEASDRLQALKECFRVLKRKGKLFAAGINRYASLYDGLSRGLVDDPYFVEIMKEDLKSGQHRNPKNHPYYFTTTIFQLPSEMEDEIRQCRFSLMNTLPVEGPIWVIKDFEMRWENKETRTQMFDFLSLLEQDAASLLMTHHYIVVAEK
jgi:ubiquinone/menaquinone biosynthesis C-methylase UbiE